MFADRAEAGRRLALALEKYRREEPYVLAIPPGGVEVGIEVAGNLGADFSVILSSRLPLPNDPGTSFGAVAEDGSTYLCFSLVRTLAPEVVQTIKMERLWEIQRQAEVLRGGRSLPKMSGRTVILVNDGVARGATTKAALLLCRKNYPDKIIVAVPVLRRKTREEIEWMTDEVISLADPESLRDVAEVYGERPAVSDESLHDMLARRENRRP